MQLFELINVIIETAILLFYFNTLYEFKKPLNFPKILLIIAEVGIVSFLGTLRFPGYINLSISYLVWLIYSICLFDGKIKNKIFMTLFYMVIVYFGDILATIIITFFGIEYHMIGGDNITYIVGAMLSNFIRLWLGTYAGRIFSRRIHALPLSYWIFMILCPVLSAMCLVIFDIYLMQAEEVNRFLVFIPPACILYINLMLFRFFETYSSNIRLKIEAELSAHKHENYMVQKSAEEEFRILRHDMKNHIAVMRDLIGKRDFEAAERHLGGIEKTMQKISSVVYTGNPIVDTVLNIGGRKAQNEGIRYDAQVRMNGDLYVEETDISTLMNNALDNAIEAAKECEDKYVFVEMNISDEIKIHIENSTKIKENKFMFATTKADKKNHGFGMKSMKSVVKKYNGYMNYESKDEKFSLDVKLENTIK